ncbi:MAG TPA: ABC transporter ATP-binding protein [Actinomycetota bacterium]|nr:ABC transporter ATP-binding protein [Actinomycetota bacterium]
MRAQVRRTEEQRSVLGRGVRIIASYVRMHPLPFAISLVGGVLYSGATVASTVVLGRVTDEIIYPAFQGGVSSATLWAGVAALVCVVAIRAGSIVVRRYFAGMTSYRMQATLRTRVIERYRDLPLAFHRSRPAGELLAHAEADVQAATDVLNPVPFSVTVIFLVLFAVVSLILTDPLLACVGLVILPLLGLLNRVYGQTVEPAATAAQQAIGEVSALAHESIDGALVVKTLGREASEVARFDERAARLEVERVRMGRLRAAFEPAFEAVPNLGIIALLAVGVWRLSTGAVTVGTLVQLVSLFQLLAFPMRMIGFVLALIPRAVVGRERLQGIFVEPSSLEVPEQAADLPPGPLGLSLRSVGFSYGHHRVLHDLTFDVAPDESVALVGPTGAGKSTLAELLVRLADVDEGSILLGGLDLRQIAPGRLRQSAAVVFQRSFMFASSVGDNIALDSGASQQEVVEAARRAQADDFIRNLPQGYDTVVGERGVTLSGGQRQRIALARALARRPRLLILDDATSAVDPTVEAAILERLRDELNTTLIVIAYRVSTIALADRVLFLDDGRIQASGKHGELMGFAPYEAMVRAYELGAAAAGARTAR